MTIYQTLAILFLFLTLAFTYVIVATFKLHRFGFNMADLALPIYAFEIVLVSAKYYTHSFLPYYAIAMSLLALFSVWWQLSKKKTFHFQKFVKFFWRSGFILTFLFYLGTVISIFLVH